MADNDELLILGTGAMASLFGARLSAVADVTLMGTWAAGLQALASDGIRVQEADGSTTNYPVRVVRGPEPCKGAKLALVLVKSWQTERAVRQLQECLDPMGIALTLQNGLGNLDALQEGLGVERAALGVTTTGATLLGPGEVRAGGSGPTYVAEHPRLEPLSNLLRSAGFTVETVSDLDRLLWRKLAINAGINPLTALLELPNGALLEVPAARELMRAAAEETARIAQASQVEFGDEDPGMLVEDVARRTAVNHSSMLQDIRRGAPTEIDVICGAIVRQGERVGVPAPINWALWKLVQARVLSMGQGEKT
jgi:2-dehydropantoate 2-reductase